MPPSTPRTCSVARTLGVVGEKWSLLVLRELFLGVHRFDEIARYTGAPRDVLAARLKTLVDAGVLERVPYNEHPPRAEYHLTGAGRDVRPVILALMAWGDRYLAGEDGPPLTLQHSCGEAFHAELVCAACHQPVHRGDLHPLWSGPGHPENAEVADAATI
ncbi:MAG: winged helix-turn-helix transcriptional regulator [Acidimicrobiales bacterium]